MNVYLILFSALLMTACEPEGATDDPGTTSVFTCTIAGKAFNATIAGATVESELSDGTLQLFAMDENTKMAVELLLDASSAQTGKTVAAEGGISYTDSGRTFAIDPEKKGTVNITFRDKNTVKGTFSFQADEDLLNPGKNLLSVTAGKFDLVIEQ